MSIFGSIEQLPPDPIFGVNTQYDQDPRPGKINLGIGVYKNAEGKSEVLGCVRIAENQIAGQNLDKQYQSILGNEVFISETLKLIFGQNSAVLRDRKVVGAQTIGATGALRVAAEFLLQNKVNDTIFLSDPTWTNHINVFRNAGMRIASYPYYDSDHHAYNFYAMQDAIEKIPRGGIILLQPCGHNPTGVGPSIQQWKTLAMQIKLRQILPFFDFAYHGFERGLEEDCEVVRLFVAMKQELLVAYTYSKNLGLYGERIGLLSAVTSDPGANARVLSHLQQRIRGNYSSPPLQGQRIATTILQSDELRKKWGHELMGIRSRINEMRVAFASGLRAKGCSNFAHIAQGKGMFACTGFDRDRIGTLSKEFGIYMPLSGRINLASLNWNNIESVINAFLSVS